MIMMITRLIQYLVIYFFPLKMYMSTFETLLLLFLRWRDSNVNIALFDILQKQNEQKKIIIIIPRQDKNWIYNVNLKNANE